MKSLVIRLTVVCMSLTFISLMLTGQSHGEFNLESALAIWLFDEDTGDEIKDFTGNGNDGIFVNGPEWVEGKFGAALKLDGDDDHVEINNPVNLVDPDFTIMLWVNPGDTQTKAHCDILSNHGEPPRSGYCIEQWSTNANQFYSAFASGGEWWAGFPDDQSASTQLTANMWQHFATIREGSVITHYLDGEESAIQEGITEDPVTESPKNLLISNFGWGTIERQFNGIIDELAIFNEALSVGDIKNIMTRGLANAASVSPSAKLPTTWAMIKTRY